MSALGPNEYICAMCGGRFERGRPVEEALAEKEKYFPDEPLEDCAEVCDDCFQKIDPETNEKKYHTYRELKQVERLMRETMELLDDLLRFMKLDDDFLSDLDAATESRSQAPGEE